MKIDNFIESQYRRLEIKPNNEFIDLYKSIDHVKLKDIFSTLHFNFVQLFASMNTRLPTGPELEAHYWAEPSRQLISAIEISENMQKTLNDSPFAFDIDDSYKNIFDQCKSFLRNSGGSTLPPNMNKIEIYYTIPIFTQKNTLIVKHPENMKSFTLNIIGEGSYAQVYKYKDNFYNKLFALKRANKDLNSKELERFKREYSEMQRLNSPYVVEVYCYIESSNEYIMEFMDMTLDKYISLNNSKLNLNQRKNIINQILKAFSYIHSKGLLHRDISPKNVLLKIYEDVLVVKISDFGLVRITDSTLTSANTEFKGAFNDPDLLVEGFDQYNILHETFALTRLLLYVLTGKTRTDKITDTKLQTMVHRGINSDKTKRFQNVEELINFTKSL